MLLKDSYSKLFIVRITQVFFEDFKVLGKKFDFSNINKAHEIIFTQDEIATRMH